METRLKQFPVLTFFMLHNIFFRLMQKKQL